MQLDQPQIFFCVDQSLKVLHDLNNTGSQAWQYYNGSSCLGLGVSWHNYVEVREGTD